MHLGNLRLRLGFVAVAVLAIAVVAFAVGVNSDAQDASAVGPTPTKIANDGPLAGVGDILVGDLGTNAGLFYCIAKTDHEVSTDQIKTSLQCNIDVPGQGDTGLTPPPWSDTNPALSNPSEPGADLVAGPPPPPPYTILAPSKGYGDHFPAGGASCSDVAGDPCVVTASCFEDVGSPAGLGPNIISVASIRTAEATVSGVDEVSTGVVDIYYNQNNTNCKGGSPVGTPDFDNLALFSIDAYDKGGANVNPNPAPWRPAAGGTTLDFDGDGCSDEDELDKNSTAKCGDDPQNPSDSFDPNTVDLTGIYDLTTRVIRADDGAPGIYFYCRIDVQHNTGDNTVEASPFCYTDSVASEINPQGYPGLNGDGYSGAPPPGLCPADPTCTADAFPVFAFADVDTNPTVLSGTFDKGTNLIEIEGCFEDQDGESSLGNVYVELAISAHQLPGTVDIWILQTLPNCQNGTPVGAPTFDNADTAFAMPNPDKGKGYDQDDDGVPTEREVGSGNACGRRDPYNQYDYYDVSIPRDGVIDLANDILGVILNFAPGGYPAGDENFDRPAPISGSAGAWNRGAPDGVIDLPNDILGVILQFNPGGCPATS